MSNLLLNFNDMNKTEKSLQGSALMTSYEKVLSILRKVHVCLNSYEEVSLADQIIYVIQKIESNSLYSYNIENEVLNMEKDVELKSIYDSLFEYSENKKNYSLAANLDKLEQNNPENKRPSRGNQVRFKTLQIKVKPVSQSLFAQEPANSHYQDEAILKVDEALNIEKEVDAEIEVIKKPQTRTKASVKIIAPASNKKASDMPSTKPKSTFDFNLKIQYSDTVLTQSIATTYFNIHDFYNEFNSESFSILSLNMFNYLELLSFIQINKFALFIETVKSGYISVPYHSEKHGVDVAHSVFTYINLAEDFEKTLKINKFDIMTLMVAALCHDIGHPGFNNNFHINSLSSYAITYNDKSVLESFHAAEATRILLRPECNFLDEMEKASFKRFRKYFIEAILSTDMTFHAKINSIVKIKLTNNNIVNGSNIECLVPDDDKMTENQQDIFNFILHTADISHNSRSFDISYKWVMALSEEFWRQGDNEKSMNLPISFLCDRDNSDIPKSQIGFLNYIILPSFNILGDLFPNLKYLIENINENIERWKNFNTDSDKAQVYQASSNTLIHHNTASIVSVGSNGNGKNPALVFQTHFTSINFDGESISD